MSHESQLVCLNIILTTYPNNINKYAKISSTEINTVHKSIQLPTVDESLAWIMMTTGQFYDSHSVSSVFSRFSICQDNNRSLMAILPFNLSSSACSIRKVMNNKRDNLKMKNESPDSICHFDLYVRINEYKVALII